ncbi:PilZ domain-containing protein [Pseudoalteromonas sp. MMG010]|uniref:PilZ domain-containing protein n=1 Tax=Pseudoalteromonas sp. MMG010 TaxID=2822685 RepID=UPI001B39D385|nr:PilZ domain-containing protein [Pseudoalteromonas sp. MMG010]MBQ4833289.1 PilZ domain-containing protein [Pseudoalteromonas sp. MMG010]
MFTEDKRNFRRMQMNTPATLTTLEPQSGLTYQVLCVDISATGIAIHLDELLELDTIVQIIMKPTHSSIAPLNATARVIRANKDDEGTIGAGLEIIAFN